MAYETVQTNVGDDFVATITLNRPDQLNTFTTELANELNAALLEADADEQVRVIVVRGAGKAFCAGIDVNKLFGQTPSQYRDWIEAMERPLETIENAHRLLPGEWVIPLDDILVSLKQTGFDGLCSVELFRPEYWERDPGELATAARTATLEIVRHYFEPSESI